MSDESKAISPRELRVIYEEELVPVSYAWSHPVASYEPFLMNWWASLPAEDQEAIYAYWRKGLL